MPNTSRAIASLLAEIAAAFGVPLELGECEGVESSQNMVVRVATSERTGLELSCDRALARSLSVRTLQEPADGLGPDDDRHVLSELAHVIGQRVRTEQLASGDREQLELCFRSGDRSLVVRTVAAVDTSPS